MPSACGSAGRGRGARRSGPVEDKDDEAAHDSSHFQANVLKVPQRELPSLSKVYVSDLPVRPVRVEQVEDLRADLFFMTGQCKTKSLLLTPVLVDDPAR